MTSKQTSLLFPLAIFGIFLCLGLAAAGYFISNTLLNGKNAGNTITVKGLSERNVTSNIAEWKINFTITGDTNDAAQSLYKAADGFTGKIIASLNSSGINKKDIAKGMYNYHEQDLTRYSNAHNIQKRLAKTLRGSISIRTNDVTLPNKLASKVNSFVGNNITIDNNVSYLFTKLNQIKPEMVQEANKNARVAAEQFAKDANVQIDSLQNARQGQFVIRDIGESYGSDKSIEKVVRVITNITYYIRDK